MRRFQSVFRRLPLVGQAVIRGLFVVIVSPLAFAAVGAEIRWATVLAGAAGASVAVYGVEVWRRRSNA